MSMEGPNKPVNWAAIDEIANADNAAILAMLEGGATADVTLDEADIEAIRASAIDLGTRLGNENPAVQKSAQELFGMAYESYVKEAAHAGAQAIERMSDAELRQFVVDEGYEISDDELQAFRKSGMNPDEWFTQRSTKDAVEPFTVAVDESGNVVAKGATAAEAMRRAQDETGR